jgi:CspA family cold shock protein
MSLILGLTPATIFNRSFLMAKGTVKWFNEKKGFGFLSHDDGTDLFVHHTGIIGNGFKTLYEGDKVEFEVEKGEKGPRAISVRTIS